MKKDTESFDCNQLRRLILGRDNHETHYEVRWENRGGDACSVTLVYRPKGINFDPLNWAAPEMVGMKVLYCTKHERKRTTNTIRICDRTLRISDLIAKLVELRGGDPEEWSNINALGMRTSAVAKEK